MSTRTTNATGGQLMAREGLLDVVHQFTDKTVSFWPWLVGQTESTRQAYEQFLLDGDYPMASDVDETDAIPVSDFRTNYNKTLYLINRALAATVSAQVEYTDLYGIVKRIGPKMARAMAKTKEQVVANRFSNCVSTATADLLADGKPLLSTTHPHAAGVANNRVQTSGSDLALGANALAQGIQLMMQCVTDQGDPNPMPGPYKLLVPTQLMELAQRLVVPGGRPQTADNDKNVFASMYAGTQANPFLTLTNSWFLIADSENPVTLLTRMPLTTKEFPQENLTTKFVVYEEYMAYIKDWRPIVGSYIS